MREGRIPILKRCCLPFPNRPFPVFFHGSVAITLSAVTSFRVKCQDPFDPDTITLSSPQKFQAILQSGGLSILFPTLIDEKVTKVIDSGHVIIN